ncbi:hypothetical protein F5Y03DRAFT_228647 [Xylaria venustula]|nr:hypothetical protein F5Y03DRAFT_228647 [Xylaria venustula]
MENTSNPADDAPRFVPVSGSILFEREIERRKKLRKRGVISTGCSEIDDALLLGGGFERGCVIGVSSEEVDFGVLLGLQTIARTLVFECHSNQNNPSVLDGSKQRATLITTLPVTTVLPTLRDIIRYQVQCKLGPRNPGFDAELRRCLEAITISRIFDFEGLWEVLRELEDARDKTETRENGSGNGETASPHVPGDKQEETMNSAAERTAKSPGIEKDEEKGAQEASPENAGEKNTTVVPSGHTQEPRIPSPEPAAQLPPLRPEPQLQPLPRNTEILDSEDEEPLSSSPLSSPPPSTVAAESPLPSEEEPQAPTEPDLDPRPSPSPDAEAEEKPQKSDVHPSASTSTENSPLPVPDIIVVTHFSALLTTLFTHNDKTAAHTNLQLLSSHLRHLAQSAGPMIMLLNTTTSPSPETFTSASTSASGGLGPFTGANNPIPPHPADQEPTKQQRPLDPTLRSIFNPAPPHQPHTYDHYGHSTAAAASRLARRNKPAFGATFAQFLDLHLLCTRIPRTPDDAETAVALGAGADAGDVKYAWVVEALLDELGFWDWGRARKNQGTEVGIPPRVNREQCWGAVDVRDRVAVVNAFSGDGSGNGRPVVDRGPVRLAAGFGGPRV